MIDWRHHFTFLFCWNVEDLLSGVADGAPPTSWKFQCHESRDRANDSALVGNFSANVQRHLPIAYYSFLYANFCCMQINWGCQHFFKKLLLLKNICSNGIVILWTCSGMALKALGNCSQRASIFHFRWNFPRKVKIDKETVDFLWAEPVVIC